MYTFYFFPTLVLTSKSPFSEIVLVKLTSFSRWIICLYVALLKECYARHLINVLCLLLVSDFISDQGYSEKGSESLKFHSGKLFQWGKYGLRPALLGSEVAFPAQFGLFKTTSCFYSFNIFTSARYLFLFFLFVKMVEFLLTAFFFLSIAYTKHLTAFLLLNPSFKLKNNQKKSKNSPNIMVVS